MLNRYVLLILAAILLAGCPGEPPVEKEEPASGQQPGSEEQVAPAEPATPEEAVAQRARERWELIIAWKLDEAYEYISPGMRQAITLPVFKAKVSGGSVRRTAVSATEANCSEDLCEVSLVLQYLYNGKIDELAGKVMESTINEKWILVDGQWWVVPKK